MDRVKNILLAFLLAPVLSAQLSPRPADAIVPVVGSTRGQANANFKTELQMTNRVRRRDVGMVVPPPAGRDAAL